MNSRERIRLIMDGKSADRCGFWLGMPHSDTWPIYRDHFNVSDLEELHALLGSDLRWITPEWNSYRHPEGRGIFDLGIEKGGHGQAGPLAKCEDAGEVEMFEWPDVDYLDFGPILAKLRETGDVYRASGFWTPFFHVIMDLFGMEDYMVKMFTHPEVVHAVTDRVCGFYYEANQRFYAQAGDLIDAFFFGNDFGTQLDVMCGPEQFDEFILPWFRKFTQQAHESHYKVILHSCGSIFRVIDRLIDSGVDCLHPLQAKARNMEAEILARYFKGRVVFMGGIDTQELLVKGGPEEVRAEVRRIKEILAPGLIVSPSHEALLPNVPPENVAAMSDAARE
ncbi:MAG: uroporphyrinogen decarboxylase family protein [Candidatus Eisenbacteria bacterium]|uniref:Uroporphyrinogen decarboxylase family protein n=1 Tax=Eiseniibacteriota bacterium TaxID=2212470 RepID=A0A948RWQ5_UNCEI|nr:uroporphyrinogen decarboxylase family protein [Candidatus Eisenbacteria bacterium]MBU1948806.1 uroporphyrinogen decarboxylase family protein [Candidatus Eisenbacteria bacterium]MBU2692433.1 uroporphyrinogen decarboxylase family protein [Candidatus Eisenbacteria bacterium]